MSEGPPVARTLEEANAIIAAQHAETVALRGKVAALEAQVAELRARRGLDSTNSSRPPSSDGPASRFKRKPPEAPSGRKVGAQPGHQGHRHGVVTAENAGEVIDVRPDRCRHCGASLEEAGDGEIVGEVAQIDVPEIEPHTRLYRLRRVRCPRCRARTRGELPPGTRGTLYGPRVHAIVTTLGAESHASRETTSALMDELFHVDISTGAVQACIERASEAMARASDEVRSAVIASEVVHLDETSWPLGKKTGWLWTAATSDAVAFHIGNTRSRKDRDAMMPAGFSGIAVTDRYGVYHDLAPPRHQLCHAHLRRDFQALIDRGGEAAVVGTRLLIASNALFAAWHAFGRGELDAAEMHAEMRPVRTAFDRALAAGTAAADKRAARLCRSLLAAGSSLWLFAEHDGVEPTNNFAEQQIRPAVRWRKNCYGTRSDAGARFAERALTVLATARRRGFDALDWLTHAVAQHLAQRPLDALPATP